MRRDPSLAAALVSLGYADNRELPLVAAYWVADGRSSPALVDLAGLGPAAQPEISELWPAVVAEVAPDAAPQDHRRRAVSYLAAQCLANRISTRLLVSLLWPDHEAGIDNEDLDAVVYGLDDLLDAIDLRGEDHASGRSWAGPPTTEALVQRVQEVLVLLSRDDVEHAAAAL